MPLRFFWFAACLLLGCRSKRVDEPSANVEKPLTVSSALAPSASALPEPEVTTLLRLSESGYHAVLSVDGDVVYMLNGNAAYRLQPGVEPRKMPLDLGLGPAFTQTSIVYWSEGAIHRVAKQGSKPSLVAKLPHQPQNFVASGERFAWLDHADDGRYTIQTLVQGKPRVLLTVTQHVDAVSILNEQVYFVERREDGVWRIGVVSVEGGEARYSAEHSGRTPSMLVADSAVYYYDGNAYELRQFASDSSESVVAKGLVCSPLAAAGDVLCGSVEGPYEVSRQNPKPRYLAPLGGRLVTAIAGSASRVAWVRDDGSDKLVVETVSRAAR